MTQIAITIDRLADLIEPTTNDMAIQDMGHVINKRLPDGGRFIMTVHADGRSHLLILPPLDRLPSSR